MNDFEKYSIQLFAIHETSVFREYGEKDYFYASVVQCFCMKNLLRMNNCSCILSIKIKKANKSLMHYAIIFPMEICDNRDIFLITRFDD